MFWKKANHMKKVRFR